MTNNSIYMKLINMGDKNKQRLFEVMERLNPDFKVSEILTPQPAPTQAGTGTVSPDVANLQKASQKSPAMQTANSRIDTPQEFEQGFTIWFSTTGFNPQKKPLSISQAQTSVRRAMEKLGYK
jgi:hypothetical protein